MHQHLTSLLHHYFHIYGYWVILVALLLENSGLPVPGETTLLLGSFLAFSEHSLRLRYIILVGIGAATLGDNIGYAIGRYGGRPLLLHYQRFFHLPPDRMAKGEQFVVRHGAAAVFFARFIAGLRVLNGPIAGALRMEWRRFLLFNFLGAAAWVVIIATVGYFFGSHLGAIIHLVKRFNLALLAILVVTVVAYWYRSRRKSRTASSD